LTTGPAFQKSNWALILKSRASKIPNGRCHALKLTIGGGHTFVYVSAARGFKSGGFNTSAREPGKALSPEFAWSYEGGLKRSIAGGRIRANTAVFQNNYHDLQPIVSGSNAPDPLSRPS
jgi:outer membrane receptor protein involved in Fe transport